MVDDYSYLPSVLQEIADVAGLAAALQLAAARGGETVYIPGHVDGKHWLSQIVGLEAACKICDYYRIRNGGLALLIPMGNKKHSIYQALCALDEGYSTREIVRKYGLHERTVYRLRARKRSHNNQQDELF